MGEFAGLDLRDARTRGRPDFLLVVAVIILSFFGLVMIYGRALP
jgi:hypothetical protein